MCKKSTSNFSSLSDELIKSESVNWNNDQWEKYLKSTECQRVEALISPKVFDELGRNIPVSVDVDENVSPLESLANIDFTKYLERLPLLDKKIIESIYWEGLSQRATAKNLGISRVCLQWRLKQSLKKIKSMILNESPSNLPLI